MAVAAELYSYDHTGINTDGWQRSSMEDLRHFEKRLNRIQFTIERSGLGEINKDFCPVKGSTFNDCLGDFSRRGNMHVLEIGGGQYQTAAREILDTYPGISRYVAFEGLPLDQNVEEVLSPLIESERFSFINKGISEICSDLQSPDFDVVFAHRVIPFLPNPWGFMERVYSLLREDGVAFFDAIPVFKGVLALTVKFLEQQGHKIYFRTPTIQEFKLVIRDIVVASISIQRTKTPLVFPLKEGVDNMSDSEGKTFITREFYFDPAVATITQ